jgi:hypothetical protein
MPLFVDHALKARVASEQSASAVKEVACLQCQYADAQWLLCSVTENKELSAAHRATILKITGAGFQLEKTLRTHVAQWVSQIEAAYPSDTRKQYELVCEYGYRGAHCRRCLGARVRTDTTCHSQCTAG